jgi:hypothetical protein
VEDEQNTPEPTGGRARELFCRQCRLSHRVDVRLGRDGQAFSKRESGVFFEAGWTLIGPTSRFARESPLPSSIIYLHPQSPDVYFIAAKTRIAVASRNGARAGVDQIVTSNPRAVALRQPF